MSLATKRWLTLGIGLAALIIAGASFLLLRADPRDPLTALYEDTTEELAAIVEAHGPRAALDELHRRSLVEEDLAGICHPLAHTIGHRAYERLGFTGSLLPESDVCGSGYTHGVVESHFSQLTDLEAGLHSICAPDEGKCFHGLGHGLMYATENNLTRSVALCASLTEKAQRVQCAEGAFMEIYHTDLASHPTPLLREDDPFLPCRGQEEPYKGVCAFYAPRFFVHIHPRAYREALAWCLTLTDEPESIPACVKGLGSVAIKENVLDPPGVTALCLSAPEDVLPFCVEGMVSYYIVHFAAASRGAELCPAFTGEARARCEKVVRESEKFYPE